MTTYPIEVPRADERTSKMSVGEFVDFFYETSPANWRWQPTAYEKAAWKVSEAQINLVLTAMHDDYEDIVNANWKEVCERYNAVWFPEEYYDDLMV